MKKYRVFLTVLSVCIILATAGILIIKNKADNKLKDGYVKDNLIHYSFVSEDEIDELDEISKSVFNSVKCTFANVVYNSNNTGTADITVFYPDMEVIMIETYNNTVNDPSVLSKFNGETEWDKYEEYLCSEIEIASLSEKTVSVELTCEEDIWKIVLTPEVSDLLSGNIEKAYVRIFNGEE